MQGFFHFLKWGIVNQVAHVCRFSPISRAPDLSSISEVEHLGVNVVTLSPGEREAFVKATRKIYQKWSKTIGQDLVNKAEKAVAARKKI